MTTHQEEAACAVNADRLTATSTTNTDTYFTPQSGVCHFDGDAPADDPDCDEWPEPTSIDSLTRRCPQCGSLEEYPDCVSCGFMFDGASSPASSSCVKDLSGVQSDSGEESQVTRCTSLRDVWHSVSVTPSGVDGDASTANTLDMPPARPSVPEVPAPQPLASHATEPAPTSRETIDFLTLLAEAEDVTFQTFADDKNRPGAGKLAQVLHGDLGLWGEYLHKRNSKGAGVFVMVNQGDGRGREASNVTRVRALFADLDGSPLAPVLDAGLEPHAVVESSLGRWHAYWLVDDCSLEQFKPMQQALAAKFCGDRTVCDLPRVMRLPGFLHQKGEPFMTRLHSISPRLPYTLDEIRTTLDLQPPASQSAAVYASVEPVEISDTLLCDLRSALHAIPADEYQMWVRIGHALKTLGDPGLGLWQDWSKTSEKHQPEVDRKTWFSFNPTRTSHKVVFSEAQSRGWANPGKSIAVPESTNFAKLVSAMDAIPAGERSKDWDVVIKGLHWETIGTADNEAALAALKAWCPENAKDCDATWGTLRGPDEMKSSPITGASIFKIAHQHGWKGASVVSNANAPWEPPEDLIASTASEPYPLDALPGGLGTAVQEVVEFVQCPPALAACAALSALSLAGQALADVRRSEGLAGPVSLFVLAVAESGERKSSCDGYFTSTIKTWQHERMIASKPDVARGQAKLAEWEASREGIIAAIKAHAKSDKSTDELSEKLERLEMNPPMPVLVPNLIYSDATPEALAFALSRKWPSGGVMSSEAGAVFGGHAMTSDSAMRNMSMLNALWDGGEVKIERRTSECFTVRGARLTMGLAVQPETVRAFFASTKGLARGIGFSARYLIAWPATTQGTRLFRPAPEAMPAVNTFGRRLAQMLDETPWPDAAEQIQRRMLDLSDEGHAVWRSFHDDVERELAHSGDLIDVRDVASKAADNAARMAALFHLFEPGVEGEISAAHMRAASTIMTWHLYEARRFYGEIALPKGLANAVKLDAWLLKREEAMVPTRVVRQYGPNALRDARALEEAMAILAEAHRARIVEIGRKKVIQLNPELVCGLLKAAA